MFARLPEPDRAALRSAPVNLVVYSLNYAATSPWLPQAGIRWRDALERHGINGKLLGANQQQLTMIPGVVPEQRIRHGYQVSQQNVLSATLYEDGLVFETRQYDGWAQYRSVLERLIQTAAQQREIAVVTNTSLRYVNALSDQGAESAAYWRGKVQDPFLGPASDEELLDDFKRGIYLLTFNDGVINAEVRIGVQPDAVLANRVAFVFDMDFTDTEQREFNAEELLGRADVLNTAALKVFQRILAPGYLQELANV
jgi:uncharacterized protein (TIGR04255 family)